MSSIKVKLTSYRSKIKGKLTRYRYRYSSRHNCVGNIQYMYTADSSRLYLYILVKIALDHLILIKLIFSHM